mgnify:CR=1 FL=1|tara:strand:- start:69 stop:467 length:399 start_codon:yes stop_codon:yes gene_type:complete
MKTSSRTFSQVILQLFSLIFLITGLLLLLFTEQIQEAALNSLTIIASRLTIVIQQFLGNAYILLGALLYLFKNSKGKPLYITLTSLFIMGFINLYLIFQFNDLIYLPAIYFIFQSLLLVLLLVALIDEARKN